MRKRSKLSVSVHFKSSPIYASNDVKPGFQSGDNKMEHGMQPSGPSLGAEVAQPTVSKGLSHDIGASIAADPVNSPQVVTSPQNVEPGSPGSALHCSSVDLAAANSTSQYSYGDFEMEVDFLEGKGDDVADDEFLDVEDSGTMSVGPDMSKKHKLAEEEDDLSSPSPSSG